MATNPYDQFDAAGAASEGNPYDRFDGAAKPAPAATKEEPRRTLPFVTGNINKGIAGVLDAPGNAMTDVYNLGKAAVGTALTAAGRPDLAPDLTPHPDGFRKIGEATGMITGQAEPRTTGEKIAAEALQLGGGMAVPLGPAKQPGAFTQLRKAAEVAASERAAQGATIAKTLQESRKLGYVVPPSQVSSSLTGNAVEGLIARTAPIERVASTKNAAITNRLVRRDLGLTPIQPVTDQTFEAIRRDAGQAYEAIKKSGVQIKADKEFDTALQKIKSSDYGQAAGEYGDILGNEAVANLVKGINKPEVSSTAAVEMVKELRRRATKNLKAWDDLEKQDLGNAQRQAAQALEDLIGRNLQGAGRGKLAQDWKDARSLIAKSYDAEAAWDGSNFSAKQLTKLAEKGSPLTGGMAQAAEFARHFPKAAQDVTKMAQKSGFSQYDLWGGLAGATLTGHPEALAIAAIPWATQRALLSSAGQKMFATPDYKVGLGLRTMAELDPLFQRALAQSAIQSGQK